MDKQLINLVKNGIRLYYRILKLHQKVLPGKLKQFGNIYVKQQFRYHHTNPTIHYYKQFYEKWLKYELELTNKGLFQASRPLSQQENKLLNNDQIDALNVLKESIQKKQIVK